MPSRASDSDSVRGFDFGFGIVWASSLDIFPIFVSPTLLMETPAAPRTGTCRPGARPLDAAQNDPPLEDLREASEARPPSAHSTRLTRARPLSGARTGRERSDRLLVFSPSRKPCTRLGTAREFERHGRHHRHPSGDAEPRRERASGGRGAAEAGSGAEPRGFPHQPLRRARERAEAPETRRLAGLILKNALDARDEGRKAELQQKWLEIDPNTRGGIKAAVWQTLGSPVSEIRHTCAQVIAKIAGAEIPQKQWPDLVQNLQANVANAAGPPGLRQATLEALGYVCEEVEHEHLEEAQVNAMLTAIVQGMRKEEPDNEVRLAATVALANALFFAETNFERENERNYIMQVTCEATVCADVRVRQAAYEVLVGVAENYYDKLAPYITAIFDLTTKATKGDEESVALQAIEFWSAVCEEEVAIQEEIEDGGADPVVYHRFVEQALQHLVPMLLETLTKQDEDELDEGDDVWNLAMAGGTCLGLVATCVQDKVVDHVMPFIHANISQAEWRLARRRRSRSVPSSRDRTPPSSRPWRRRRSPSCSTP